MSKHPDAVVVGGGIIGLTSAYFLARSGFAVEVLDRGDLGTEASWAGAGILPPGNPERAATPIDKLRAIGSVRFPQLAEELRSLTGIDTGYRKCGGIEFLGPDDADVPALWKAEGIDHVALSREGVARLEPAIAHAPGTAYLLRDCAQVRNPWHLRALIAACGVAGVSLRPHERAREWVIENGRVVGLSLEGGRPVHAGRFLIAAGAWSRELLSPLGQKPDIHPVRGQIVLLNHPPPVLSRVLMLGKEYLVPRGDGRILVGSTEEPEAGFVKANTAEAVERLKQLAFRVIPALRRAAVEKTWAGLRPGSPDGLPFLGLVPDHENVFVAAGHFRAGVQLSIGTAEVIGELFRGEPTSVPLEPFRIDRVPAVGGKAAFRS